MNAFVTGTDTGVGKTFCTALITRSLRRAGLDTVALKPICCGPRDDVAALCAASGNELSEENTNPVWLKAPATPLVAARLENRSIEVEELKSWLQRIRSHRRSVLVEGAGGWLVPSREGQTMADIAIAFELPVLVVVANRLGCLNHTLLTIESIRNRGLSCAGLVLNTISPDDSIAQETNRRVLAETCDVPILFDIGPGQGDLDLAVV